MALALSTINALVARQWLSNRKPHQLLWLVALFVWTLAVAAETASAYRRSWDPVSYQAYYAFGALMVASWLGAGSLFLVAPRRLAIGFFLFIGVLSLVGCWLIFTRAIEPGLLAQTDALGSVDLKIIPLIPVPILIVVGNVLGILAFTGSALFSVWRTLRQGMPRRPMFGILLVGLGGLVAASEHSIGVLGGPGLFRASELLAVVLIFVGYSLGTRPLAQPAAPQPA